MKILVLIKEVPDMERVRFDRERGVVDRASANGEINPFDLYALQAAFDLKCKYGGHITAVSMGPAKSELSLRDAAARGADSCLLVTDRKFGGSDTLATSRILAAAISKLEYDLILCGEKTVDGDTAQVGAEVAELLNIPHSYYVENVDATDAVKNGGIIVETSEICGVKQKRAMKLPALVSVSKSIARPLLPALKSKLDSIDMKIDRVGLAELEGLLDVDKIGVKGSSTKVSKIVVPKETVREGVIFRGDSPDDSIKGFLKAVREVLGQSKPADMGTGPTATPDTCRSDDQSKLRGLGTDLQLDDQSKLRGLGTGPQWGVGQRPTVLVLGETRGNSIHPVTYELMGKGQELAKDFECALECLLLCGDEVEMPTGQGTYYIMCAPEFANAEENLYKANIVRFISERKPRAVLVGATNFGRSLAPRVAAALGTGLTADCTELLASKDDGLIQIRPAFSDNILAHITSSTYPHMATVRHGEFPLPECVGEPDITVIPPYVLDYDGTTVIETFASASRDISEADVIIACGRGLKTVEDIKLIQTLADKLKAQIGYTRTLVEAGFATAERQIGYSGIRVRPRIYIALGISGAPQHIAGMKESDIIIAVNRDPSAPIFNICDVGYVGDLYQVVQELSI